MLKVIPERGECLAIGFNDSQGTTELGSALKSATLLRRLFVFFGFGWVEQLYQIGDMNQEVVNVVKHYLCWLMPVQSIAPSECTSLCELALKSDLTDIDAENHRVQG